MKTVDDSAEIDLWWGSYSGWSMLPSFLVCVFLTGIIVVLVGIFESREWAPWTITGLVWPLWAIQLARFSYRVFTRNYRLTSRTLYCDEGFWCTRKTLTPLAEIRTTWIRFRGFDQSLGRGDIVVRGDEDQVLVILECVATPSKIAEKITRHATTVRNRKSSETETATPSAPATPDAS